MRFLIVNTDYRGFTGWLYARHPGLERRSYDEQMKIRNASLFGVADFYSSNLRRLGHEAHDIRVNNEFMQHAWAREHGVRLSFGRSLRFRLRRGVVPWVSLARNRKWMYEVLAAQIGHYKPDVLLNQNILFGGGFLREVKPHVRLLVGQHAATRLPGKEDAGAYDLVVSSFPPTLEWVRAKGIPAELIRLGFEPRILSQLGSAEKTIPVSFVGSLLPVHAARTEWLEYLCASLQARVFSPDLGNVPASSPIRRAYSGPAWGKDMYAVIRRSVLTLNHHGSVPPYANNMRLYEATGVGTLLVTDWKENLGEMFEPGREVVAYRSPEECVELVRYYLDHDAERERIARAGQERTLREHTYYHRMRELVDIVRAHL